MLRFAPRESQKEMAELTHNLAAKVNREGTFPGSLVSIRLEKGTRAATMYMGRPKNPPDMSQFDAISQQAELDARDRPDPWELADGALELSIGVAALFTGAAGVKTAKFLKDTKMKAKALREVIEKNEVLKRKHPEAFHAAHKSQSSETRRVVSDVRSSSPVVEATNSHNS
jgi:hypothetical protein